MTTSRISRPLLVLPLVIAGGLMLSACQKEAKEELDKGSVARGEKLSTACVTCHHFSGTENLVGPPLQGVFGRTSGTVPGFAYSDGMKAAAIVWTPDKVIAFIQDPAGMVPDTKMALGEFSKQQATDVVTYLRSLNE